MQEPHHLDAHDPFHKTDSPATRPSQFHKPENNEGSSKVFWIASRAKSKADLDRLFSCTPSRMCRTGLTVNKIWILGFCFFNSV